MPPVPRGSVMHLARPLPIVDRCLRTAAIATSPFSAFVQTRSPRSKPLQLQQSRCHHRCSIPAHATPPSHRSYHSLDHPTELPPQDRFGPDEQAILAAAYSHIPEHGFSNRALALGARDAGYPAISTSILPDGVFSLVRWHLASQRLALAPRCRAIFADSQTTPDSTPLPLSPAVITEHAERITWERLMGNKAIIGRWQEALAIMAQPSYVPASLRELALLVDEIWALARDTAVDPSWYAKRASLSAIYVSSELFMTTDPDSEFSATRDFLHRRFHEAQEFSGYLGAAGQWAGFTASASVNVLRSKGLPI